MTARRQYRACWVTVVIQDVSVLLTELEHHSPIALHRYRPPAVEFTKFFDGSVSREKPATAINNGELIQIVDVHVENVK